MNWRKSTRSASNGACVEVAHTDQGVHVRDSKDETGPVLRFTAAEFEAFIEGVKRGEFDM